MTQSAFLTHILFGLVLFLISARLTRGLAYHIRLMDIPNDRSSHKVPTPRAGGIAIISTFLLGVLLIYFFGDATPITERYFRGFIVAIFAVALVAFLDDINYKVFSIKLASQAIAALVVIGFGIVVDEIGIPWVGQISLGFLAYPLTFLWILGVTNAYNFMDGLDGLAGGVGALVCVFFGYITFSQGSTFVYILCYAILAGTLGFLIYNFPPARIFMGDVGSSFLGFVFATMAVIAARYDHSHTSFFVMPLLLLNFIFDTSFTFIRRLIKGEYVTHAHRTHLYQLLNRLGWTHRQVSLTQYGMVLAQGIGAIVMLRIEGDKRVFIFVPYLAVYLLYAWIVIGRAKAAKIL